VNGQACIIYIHGNAWEGVPARQRYLMEQMSRFLPIFYLEETEQKRWRVSWTQVTDNVVVGSGLLSGLVRFQRRAMKNKLPIWPWAQSLWCKRHLGWVRKKYRRILLWDAENWLGSYRFVPHDRLIFDCIDPLFSDDPARLTAFAKRDEQMCRHADLVFASADSLAEKCRRHNPNVILLNNACAPEEYTPSLLESACRPEWWPTSNRSIAAYLGTLDARFDFTAVLAACRAHPSVDFVLAGTILPQYEGRIKELQTLPNVICPGRISVEDGRYLLDHCTVGLIPFVPGEMNDAINPVKMYAYAQLGKPMAGTAVRELTSRPQIVATAARSEDFGNAVAAALAQADSPETRQRLIQFAAINTWRQRAETAWDAISKFVD